MSRQQDDIAAIIRTALAEDVGTGDATSKSVFGSDDRIRGTCTAKSEGVVAGLEVAGSVFAAVDPDTVWTPSVTEGSPVGAGTSIATVQGPAWAILTAERTALNFLQRMSGIATVTRQFVEAVSGTSCVILDTRKTVPGLRILDKAAVRAGGGQNHRIGLFDMVLLKDNHIDAAGSITKAVGKVRSGPHGGLPIEVECRTLEDVSEAKALNVDRIMLDNMDLETVRKAVRLTDGSVPLEASGNITLENVRLYAETGISYVSVGALTHSVRAMDISLTIIS